MYQPDKVSNPVFKATRMICKLDTDKDVFWLLGKEGGVGHKEGLDSDQEYDINEGPEYMKELADTSAMKGKGQQAHHDSSITPLTPKLENLMR